MSRRIILSLIVVFGLATGLAFLTSPKVQADANSFCTNQYPGGGNPEQAACKSGYKFEQQNSSICEVQFRVSVEFPAGSGNHVAAKDIQDACKAGWEQWKRDHAACNGNAGCQSDLRPSDDLAGDGEVDDGLNQPGPIPGSADVDKLKGDERAEHTDCGIDSFFGDLICGFSNTFATIADSAFWLLSIFLKVPPLISGTGEESSEIYDAWVNMRNLANVAFVAAFLVVIYSQLTGIGLSNYNIKKMIPRMIVAAIMINISFYLSALLVDVSNVLGATITSTITEIVPPVQVEGNSMDTWKKIIGTTLMLTGPVIAAGAAYLYVSMAAIIPILASVVIVLAITLLVLILRQALIIVFIVISPLAMAALILPGTRQYFDKWRKIFIPLVMLYPAIAVVYGGAHIASQIISQVGYANDSLILSVAALGIQVVPLALTPALMKLGGGLMNRYTGIAQGSTPIGKFKQKADDYAKYRGNARLNQALNRQEGKKLRTVKNALTNPRDKALQRKLTKQAASKNVDLVHSGALEDYAIDQMSNEDTSFAQKAMQKASFGLYQSKTEAEKFTRQVAGTNDNDSLSRAKAHTINKKVKMRANKVKAQALALARDGVSGSALTDMAVQGILGGQQVSEIQREAAILRIAQMGDAAGVIQLMKISGQGGTIVNSAGQTITIPPLTVNQRQQLVSAAQASGGVVGKAPFVMNESAAENIRQGFVNEGNFSQTVVGNSIAEDDYSPEMFMELDGNGGNELVAAASIVTRPDQINDPANPNYPSQPDYDPSRPTYDPSRPIIKQQTHESNLDLKQAAFESLNTPRVESGMTGGRDAAQALANQLNTPPPTAAPTPAPPSTPPPPPTTPPSPPTPGSNSQNNPPTGGQP